MSPGTARTMMQSQRLGKHGSGVHRNGLLAEGRSRDIGAKSGVNLNGRLFRSGATWRHGVFAAINELRSHVITEISER